MATGTEVQILPVFILFFGLASGFSWIVLDAPFLAIPFLIAVCCGLVLLRPLWSFHLTLILMFISSFFIELDHNDKLRLVFIDFTILCCWVSWCLRGMARDREPFSFKALDIVILMFFSWSALSLLWTPLPAQGAFELMKLASGIAFFLLTREMIESRRLLGRVVILLTIVGVFQALLSLASVWFDTGYSWEQKIADRIEFMSRFWAKKTWQSDGGRGTGTAVAHTMGALLNIVIFPAIGFYFIARSARKKWAWAMSLVILTAGMTATLTKSSMASFLAGAMFVIVHIRRLRGFLVVSFLLLMVFFIAVSSVSRIRDIQASINFTGHQLDSSDSETSLGTRFTWWGEGLDKLVATAGLGYGIGGFRAAVDNVVPDGSHHAVLFDLGLIGFSIYIAILAWCFLDYYGFLKQTRDEAMRRVMLAYLAGYLVMVISWIVTLYYTYQYMWFYMGLGYAIIRISCKDDSYGLLKSENPGSFIAMPTDPV